MQPAQPPPRSPWSFFLATVKSFAGEPQPSSVSIPHPLPFHTSRAKSFNCVVSLSYKIKTLSFQEGQGPYLPISLSQFPA